MSRKPRPTTANKPAVPSGMAFESVTQQVAGEPGRSLREHFAGQAMQGLLANEANGSDTPEQIALWAVAQADALIAELARGDA